MENVATYFLASNSCEGFVSYFSDCFNPNDNWKAYIIKGGPGTGKSSFMRRIANKAQEIGEEHILCPCSSDPHSLDAVILPKKKQAIIDGTAPHTLDPRYPAVCEEILNFGQFWDTRKIQNNKEIIQITNQNKLLHKTASKFLLATGQILKDTQIVTQRNIDIEKAENYALRLCEKYIPNETGTPYEWVRFIGGVTPCGIVSYPQTITQTCQNLIILSDKFHTLSNIIISKVRDYCLENGYEIITLKNPLLPSVLDHIIIPKLSLAFITEDKNTLFDSKVRRIHAKRFLNVEDRYKERLKLNQKFAESLLTEAVNTLKKAKEIHDKLESFYINAMDFDALNKFGEDFCNKLFS